MQSGGTSGTARNRRGASSLRPSSSPFEYPGSHLSDRLPGQSYLIFGTGSTSYVKTSQFSKLCCMIALNKMLENLDTITLGGTSRPTILKYAVRNNCGSILRTLNTLFSCCGRCRSPCP